MLAHDSDLGDSGECELVGVYINIQDNAIGAHNTPQINQNYHISTVKYMTCLPKIVFNNVYTISTEHVV